jgi:pimeloyl-ACP methyl ester carboxylesterase
MLSSGATNLPPGTAERLQPFAGQLTPDQRAMARTLLDPATNEAKEDQTQMFDICESFTPAPRQGYHDPVTSSIPALVLYGLTDTQTSSADARDAAAKLGNARVLGFPEAGHGALMFSKSAKDTGLALIEQPESELATGCIEELKPRWVLPPG